MTIQSQSQPTQLIATVGATGRTISFDNPGVTLVGGVGATVVLLALAGFTYTRLYRVVKPNEVLVRSGGLGPLLSGKKVFSGGGCLVIPGFHHTISVPLTEIKVNIERRGKEGSGRGAVRTKDFLRAKLRAVLYVAVDPNSQTVLTAAERLTGQAGKLTVETILEAIEDRCDSAIRSAAKNKTLQEIDSDKEQFGQAVLSALTDDFIKIGLVLNNVALSDVEEDPTGYNPDDYLDAQGLRERTEKVSRAKKETTEVESQTAVAIATIRRDEALQLLDVKRAEEQATAKLDAETAAIRAAAEREAKVAASTEEATLKTAEEALARQTAEARITSQLGIAKAQKAADRAIVEEERGLKVAEQEAGVIVANATRERSLADAEARSAQEAIETAGEVARAERQKQVALTQAAQDAESELLRKESAARAQASAIEITAKGELAAAEAQAQRINTLAQATKQEKLALAEGLLQEIAALNTKSRISVIQELLDALGPKLVEKLPAIMEAIAPEIGEAKLYQFGGGDGSSPAKSLAGLTGLSLLQQLQEQGGLEKMLSGFLSLIPSAAPAVEGQVEADQG